MSFFGNLSTLFKSPPTEKGKNGNNFPASPTNGKPVGKPPMPSKGKVAIPSKPAAPTPTLKPVPASSSPSRPSAAPITGTSPFSSAAVTSEQQAVAQNLVREAQAKAREVIVEAKDEALAIKTKAEQEARTMARQLEEQQRQLNIKLDRLDIRLEQMDRREGDLEKQRQDLDQAKAALEAQRQDVTKRLEEVSGMTRDEAKAFLLENVEKKVSKDLAQLIRQREEEARNEADERVKEILVDSMKHGATEYVPEYTVSTVTLPSEEAKGKIIGKSGRNIHTFERYTGVDVDLDTSPTEVRLSCFDPVRREIAKISLERLIKDGRIQPTRIEEVVDKVKTEIDKVMFEAGKKLCHDVGVYNLPTDLMRLLGRFKYRFSYGQNLIAHTLEETRIGIKLAHELKADVNVVKLGCLLHDIGKVSEEVEGSHVELGVKIAKKYGMPQAVVDCIAQHHEDEPFSGVEQILVYIADAISGARPGARYENYDEYVQRLQKLEDIANKYPEVKQSYAIQAGREIRVLLDPQKSKDDDVEVLALKIRDEIKNSLTYPGTVTVTTIRESRGQQIAA